jgi:DNA-binding transcriptional MerR regulator
VFTVGAFARLAGVSAKMLRTWDAAGVLKPAWVDASSGYRYYSAAQLPDARRIVGLRDLGVSGADLRQLASGGVSLRTALERRREELERERREIERRLAVLDIGLAESTDAGAPDVVVRALRPELVATYEIRLAPDGDIGRAFYELEAHVRDAGARGHRPPGAIPAEGVIYVPLRRSMTPTDRIGRRTLPGGRVATILHRGDYDTLPDARATLERWASAAGLAAAGPLRILYLQFGAEPELRLPRGWVVGEDSAFVTELQLPVA